MVEGGLWLIFLFKEQVFVPTMARTQAGFYKPSNPDRQRRQAEQLAIGASSQHSNQGQFGYSNTVPPAFLSLCSSLWTDQTRRREKEARLLFRPAPECLLESSCCSVAAFRSPLQRDGLPVRRPKANTTITFL